MNEHEELLTRVVRPSGRLTMSSQTSDALLTHGEGQYTRTTRIGACEWSVLRFLGLHNRNKLTQSMRTYGRCQHMRDGSVSSPSQ